MKEMSRIFKESVNWDGMSASQKRVAAVFGISAFLAVALCWSWLSLPCVAVAVGSYVKMSDLDVEE